MLLLVIGIALWMAAHLFKRVAPDLRRPLGDAGKGVVAVLLVISLVLMVIGYRGAEVIPLYAPMAGMGHLNNLLMLISVIVFGAGMAKGWLWTQLRHPQLYGVLIWAIAHLLVNGDVASVLLFGGMGLWALVEVSLINRQDGGWRKPASGGIKRDGALVGIAVVMFGLIALVHYLLGHNPFLGNYA